MSRAIRFMAGAILGGAIAALIALLLAPQPGAELRQRIASNVVQLKDEIRQAATQRRAELEEELSKLRFLAPS